MEQKVYRSTTMNHLINKHIDVAIHLDPALNAARPNRPAGP
jgi:hypothetical protein